MEGLTVTAVKDSQQYLTGLSVSDAELASFHLLKHPFHGEWNYTLLPHFSHLILA
jgi:hypothetical protein